MKIIFLAMCIFICGLLRSQTNIINRSLTDSTVAILYTRVDNRMKITGERDTTAMGHLSINGGNGTITKAGRDEYIVSVRKTGSCTLLYTEYGKKVFEKKFKIDSVENVVASINGLHNTSVSVSKILENPFIKLFSPGTYFRPDASVVSFNANFILDIDSTSTTTIPAAGEHFSPEQIKWIKQLQKDDFIYFDGIRVVRPEPDIRVITLRSFWIKIE